MPADRPVAQHTRDSPEATRGAAPAVTLEEAPAAAGGAAPAAAQAVISRSAAAAAVERAVAAPAGAAVHQLGEKTPKADVSALTVPESVPAVSARTRRDRLVTAPSVPKR